MCSLAVAVCFALAVVVAALIHRCCCWAAAAVAQLATLATPAFQSFVRAYACHEKSLRAVFHVRSLHLGHVAKSFALQKTPAVLVRVALMSLQSLRLLALMVMSLCSRRAPTRARSWRSRKR